MKPFEIPYNFDKKLIDFLYILDPSGKCYDAIYCCPHKDDYWAAKRNHPNTQGLDMLKSNDMDKKTYASHIQYINKFFPGKQTLLLQQNNEVMPLEILNFYLALGFKKFIVGNLEQAKILKELSTEYEVIGSITLKANEKIFNNLEYQKYFDGFVLFFPYNRNFDAIKKLPKCFKYILLVNCDCNINCSGTKHWFATREEELTRSFNCPNSFYTNECPPDWDQIIRIRPMDLPMFDPYISVYKLQGREQTTRQIIMNLCTYLTDYSFYPNLNYSEDIYQTFPKEIPNDKL